MPGLAEARQRQADQLRIQMETKRQEAADRKALYAEEKQAIEDALRPEPLPNDAALEERTAYREREIAGIRGHLYVSSPRFASK